MKKFRTIFFGTPKFSVPFAEAINNAPFLDLVAIVTEPDQPAGRGKIIIESPVAQFGRKNNISVIKTKKISDFKIRISKLQPDLAVIVAFGQILPEKILNIPKYGFINVHPSDLPKYRGPAPIQGALLNNETQTAISIMQVDSLMDHGDILAKKFIDITDDDNYFTLEKRILKLAPEFLIDTLKKYLTNKIKPKIQHHEKATYTKMIQKTDGLINWDENINKILAKIRAYCAWPKAYTIINNKKLIIHQAHLINNKLSIDVVQLEGRRSIDFKQFLNGFKQKLPKKMLAKIILI